MAEPKITTPPEPAAPAAAFTPEQMAQLGQMIAQAKQAGFDEARALLPDDAFKAQERLAKQREAAKAPHPLEYGSLKHLQKLRDGTVITGDPYVKDGENAFRETPIRFRIEPDGKRIVGGDHDGKFL